MAVAATSTTKNPDAGTDPVVLTGSKTPEDQRSKLPDGKANMSPSGEKPDPVTPEAGVKPLKALVSITYGANKLAPPESIFTPVSAKERAELLVGEYPAAKEPTKAELALFAEESDSEFE
jgi:hypothetical protein